MTKTRFLNTWWSLASQNRELDIQGCLCWSQPAKHSCTYSIKAHEWPLGVNRAVHALRDAHAFTTLIQQKQSIAFDESFRLFLFTASHCPHTLENWASQGSVLKTLRAQCPLNPSWFAIHKKLKAPIHHCLAFCTPPPAKSWSNHPAPGLWEATFGAVWLECQL